MVEAPEPDPSETDGQMSLPTTHKGSDTATVTVDRDLCTNCGACARVCFGKPLDFVNGKLEVDPDRLFGCMGCAACMSVCPTGAITISGRDLSKDDIIELPPAEERASYEQLLALLRSRRSVRRFRDEAIEPDIVEKILAAAVTSPMGIPPSEVGVLVLEGRESVQKYAVQTLDWMRRTRRWLRPALPLMKPFISCGEYQMFREFVFPAIDAYFEKQAEGVDWLMYDAPLAMVFYGTGLNDPADPYIPASVAVVAAESLGLGSCMLGFAGYGAFYDKQIRKHWGLPEKVRPGVAVVFGHPAVFPKHSVRRRFSAVVRG
jgi:ferredoxin